MSNLHTQLSRINLAPRSTPTAYRALYQELRDLAKSEDNGPADLNLRAGEVWIRTHHEGVSTGFGFDRGEPHRAETLNLYQRESLNDNESATVALRAGPTESSGRYLKFEHKRDDGAASWDIHTVLLDTTTDTLFQAQ